MEKVKYQYKISYQEAYDAFYAIVNRRSKKAKMTVYVILGICAVITLAAYIKQPQYIGYSFLSLLCVLMMFGVWNVPVSRAKKGAKRVERVNGKYEVQITKNGYLILKDGEKIPLSGDKDTRVCETENVFAIRPNRSMTFCLPKRIMSGEEIAFVQETLKHYVKNYRAEGDFYG